MHPLILRPRALFYRTDCTRRSKFLTHALNVRIKTFVKWQQLFHCWCEGKIQVKKNGIGYEYSIFGINPLRSDLKNLRRWLFSLIWLKFEVMREWMNAYTVIQNYEFHSDIVVRNNVFLNTLLGSGSKWPKGEALLLTMVSYLEKNEWKLKYERDKNSASRFWGLH